MMRYLLLSVLCVFFFGKVRAQLTTNNSLSPVQLIQNVLLGGGVTVSNVTITGYPNAIGDFHLGSAATIGFQNGIILTTGTILSADPNFGFGNGPQGPNTSANSGVNNGYPGDALLGSLTSGTIYNATVIEFDFVPAADSIKFNYVFGSEEYPEYVCSEFNDVFGFFISGPNPTGGSYTNRNLALIPNTSFPVAINTINPGVSGSNGGFGGCTSLSYSNLYVNNSPGSILQYDGYTKKLTAKAAVVCGQNYHFKIAIADVGDGIFDSGVFIESNSFVSSNTINVTQQVSLSSDNSTINEGCGEAIVYFTRPQANSQLSDTIYLSYSGTGVLNTDYTVSANPISYIILPAGQDSVSLTIQALSDFIQEGQENINIGITGLINVCVSQTASVFLNINDVEQLTVNANDTSLCAGEVIDLYAFANGGSNNEMQFEWKDSTGTVLGNNSQLVVSTLEDSYFIVTISDNCFGAGVSDTVFVNVIDENYLMNVQFDVINNPVDTLATERCDSVVLIFSRSVIAPAVTDTFFYTITGSAQAGIDFTGLAAYIVFLPNEITKVVTIEIPDDASTEGIESIIVTSLGNPSNRCFNLPVSDVLFIKDVAPLLVAAFDTTLCIGETINLSANASGGFGSYTYLWSNGLGAGQSHTYTAGFPEVFMVQAQDGCGNTSPQDSCTISIHYNTPEIAGIPDDTSCYASDYFFYVNVINASPPAIYSFQTSFSPVVQSSAILNGFFITNTTMPETVIVQVTDRCFKTASDTFELSVKNCDIVLPTIITNNNDGINEVLYFKNLQYYPDSKLIIFNRWGMKMYQSDNYTNDYIPDYTDGTYYYILTLTTGKSYPMYFLVTH